MGYYSFCRKDGSLKIRYLDACKYIVSAKIKPHTITIHRGKEILEEYDCYTINLRKNYARERNDCLLKINEICKNFDITIRTWYSLPDITIELHGCRIPFMIEYLTDLLGGDIHIR